MSMSSSGDTGHGAPKADINTTPLVDVMLVLLIIFMITAPLMADKVPVNLPTATSEPPEKVEDTSPKVTLSIVRKNGATNYYWGEQLVTPETLAARIDRKSTRLNSSHSTLSRMPSSA